MKEWLSLGGPPGDAGGSLEELSAPRCSGWGIHPSRGRGQFPQAPRKVLEDLADGAWVQDQFRSTWEKYGGQSCAVLSHTQPGSWGGSRNSQEAIYKQRFPQGTWREWASAKHGLLIQPELTLRSGFCPGQSKLLSPLLSKGTPRTARGETVALGTCLAFSGAHCILVSFHLSARPGCLNSFVKIVTLGQKEPSPSMSRAEPSAARVASSLRRMRCPRGAP